MSRTITVRDFVQLTKQLPPMIEQAAIRGLRSAAARGVGEVVKQIDHAEPFPAVDTRAMAQSVTVEPILEGAELSVNAPQGAWMEFGTLPHMPPLLPILRWVVRKFGLSERKSTRKKRDGAKRLAKMGPKERSKMGPRDRKKHGPRMTGSGRRSHNAAKAYAIAKAVQWKIWHYGTAPRGFFKKSMVVIHTKFAPQEVRHELKALEKRL